MAGWKGRVDEYPFADIHIVQRLKGAQSFELALGYKYRNVAYSNGCEALPAGHIPRVACEQPDTQRSNQRKRSPSDMGDASQPSAQPCRDESIDGATVRPQQHPVLTKLKPRTQLFDDGSSFFLAHSHLQFSRDLFSFYIVYIKFFSFVNRCSILQESAPSSNRDVLRFLSYHTLSYPPPGHESRMSAFI